MTGFDVCSEPLTATTVTPQLDRGSQDELDVLVSVATGQPADSAKSARLAARLLKDAHKHPTCLTGNRPRGAVCDACKAARGVDDGVGSRSCVLVSAAIAAAVGMPGAVMWRYAFSFHKHPIQVLKIFLATVTYL